MTVGIGRDIECYVSLSSACGEEGSMTIVGWWKIGPLVSLYEGDGLETRLNRGSLDSMRIASTGLERTRPVMALASSN